MREPSLTAAAATAAGAMVVSREGGCTRSRVRVILARGEDHSTECTIRTGGTPDPGVHATLGSYGSQCEPADRAACDVACRTAACRRDRGGTGRQGISRTSSFAMHCGRPARSPSTVTRCSGSPCSRYSTAPWTCCYANGSQRSGPCTCPPSKGLLRPASICSRPGGGRTSRCGCELLSLAGDGTIVHLRILPGLVEDYQQLVQRALAG